MLEGVLPIKIVLWPVVERLVLPEEVLGGRWIKRVRGCE